jgi:sugar phosphate isomerase/epimerase
MRLATTTGDLGPYYEDRSVAAPVRGMKATGLRHLDLSMYRIIYPGSPWLAPGDGWKREIEQAAAAAAAEGLDFVQAHSPDGQHFGEGEARDALLLATRRSIEACAMLGVPHTVVHAQAIPGATPAEFMRENIAFYRLFEADAEKYGVALLVENSADAWNPGYYLRTGKEMREFVETAGIARLHICWDIGHANAQRLGQYADILAMGKELRALHVQDNYGHDDSHVMPLVGTTNFDRVLQGLKDVGYRGDFTFEGGNTLRRRADWPNYRRDVKPDDRLADPPLYIQQKQISVMHEIGKWMLESYGIEADG